MPFSEICGQDRPIEVIKGIIESKRIAGAYFFTGPEGVGKFFTALKFTQTLNCLKGGLDPCQICASCLKISKGFHPDIQIINEGEQEAIKIETVREIKRQLNLRPYEGNFKVCLINDAHNLTAEAANALLKILEEPPNKSVLILVSSQSKLIFKTILSRCKIIRFSALPAKKVREILINEHGFKNDYAHFLAYFYEGRLGAALKNKDTELMLKKNRLIDFFTTPDSQAGAPAQEKEELRFCLHILISWLRDLYLVKSGLKQDEMIHFDRRGDLLKTASLYEIGEVQQLLTLAHDSLWQLQHNINAKLILAQVRSRLWKT
mgnify:CR=1 FL=1